MAGKIYLDFLILCGIWSLVIVGIFADENITESSSFLVRQKRVISQVPGEDTPVRIDKHPYIVNIKRFNRIFCVGTILSDRIVITAANCGLQPVWEYKVMSSSARSFDGTVHNVTNIKLHYGNNHPVRTSDGIALFTLNPAIEFSRYSSNIKLHTELLVPGLLAYITGWGFNNQQGESRGTEIGQHLRTIQVPIISHQNCVNIYRNYLISEKEICTFDPLRRSGHTDIGAPLVIGKLLVGVFLRRGPISHPFNPAYPDVFALLQHDDYRRWIMQNMNEIRVPEKK